MSPDAGGNGKERRRPYIGRARLTSQRPKPGVYRHYKGKEYEVIDVALNAETLQVFVVYRALYGDQGVWIRPRSMFLEKVDHDGRKVLRFAPVENEDQQPLEG